MYESAEYWDRAYLLVVLRVVGSDNTCGNHGHSRHKTATGPVTLINKISISHKIATGPISLINETYISHKIATGPISLINKTSISHKTATVP